MALKWICTQKEEMIADQSVELVFAQPGLKHPHYEELIQKLSAKGWVSVPLQGHAPARDVLIVFTAAKVSGDPLEAWRVLGGQCVGEMSRLRKKTLFVRDLGGLREAEFEAFCSGIALRHYSYLDFKSKELKASDLGDFDSENQNQSKGAALSSVSRGAAAKDNFKGSFGNKAELTSAESKEGFESFIALSKNPAVAKIFEQSEHLAQSIKITRDWSNCPSNVATPEKLMQEAKALAQKHHLKCTVINAAEAKKLGMNVFLSVSAGSSQECFIVILEHLPKGHSQGKLALVGKGVTFDSGGISLKPASKMEEMKHDMTGAASVMGALVLASLSQIPTHLIGVMAFTENMPGNHATQPGSIFTAYNGKTVEVINTDAEGRLVLADALSYVESEYEPDAIVNIATLTGAVAVALGKQACAVMGNHIQWMDEVMKAGLVHHERIWPFPLFDEYLEEMKSDTADLRNISNDGSAGTIRGGIFLKQFVNHTPWAHLDIASTAWGITHLDYIPKKGASGLWVRTLVQIAKDFKPLK